MVNFLLALAITVILGSESRGTHHILQSDGSGSLQTLAKRTELFICKVKDGK
jgi:hypothetical protein